MSEKERVGWELDADSCRAIELLKSASKYGKSIKAIAVTGSINAITTGDPSDTRVLTASEWLPVRILVSRSNHPSDSHRTSH